MTGAELPRAATERLEQRTFTSDLSVDELVCLQGIGIKPLGLVLGVAVWRVQSRRENPSVIFMNQAMSSLRRLATERLEAEAGKLGADGVVGVDLDLRRDKPRPGLMELVLTGTAVITEGAASPLRLPGGRLFTAMLSAQDVWKLYRIGYAPVRMCVGYAASFVLLMRGQTRTFGPPGNYEMTNYTKTLGKVRSLALDQMESEARGAGADGIVGVRLDLSAMGEASRFVECFATGTSVVRTRGRHQPPTPRTALYLSG